MYKSMLAQVMPPGIVEAVCLLSVAGG
jgi:hypothetical protein